MTNHGDTRAPRSLFAPTNCVRMSSKARLPEQPGTDKDHDDQENQGKGKQLNNLTGTYSLQVRGQVEEAHTSIGQEVQQVRVADLADAIRLYADRLSTGENKARTTSYAVHTQRDNEGRHTQSGNDQAVHQAGNEANDQANSQAGQHHNEQWRATPYTAHDQGRG